MKFLHTADWHLGDRLGRIDRTEDLRHAVERVAGYCETHQVDVLLVAGDLFSEMSRPDSLRASIEHLQATFEPFLLRGGTILAVTGNHDNENFCQTLGLVMKLAAPTTSQAGDLRERGRLYLATQPTFLRLADRDGQEVQFILMPYPTEARYLRDEETQKYGSAEEKNRHLQTAYATQLREIQAHPRYAPTLPTVLMAHIHVQGAALPSLFKITEQESIIFSENDLPTHLAYVALGHIHQAQRLMGLSHVRYCGSIERLDLGEQRDDKSVVVFEIGPEGRRGEPILLPVEATPIRRVEVYTPLKDAIEMLRQQYPDAHRDLVKIELRYLAGVDNLEESLRELEKIFPRWYLRDWNPLGEGPDVGPVNEHHGKSFKETVRGYLADELMNEPEEDRNAVLARAEALLNEEGEE